MVIRLVRTKSACQVGGICVLEKGEVVPMGTKRPDGNRTPAGPLVCFGFGSTDRCELASATPEVRECSQVVRPAADVTWACVCLGATVDPAIGVSGCSPARR